MFIQLVEHISRDAFEPHVALMNKTGVYLEHVPDDVQVHDLAKRSAFSFFGLQWRISRLVRKLDPDAVVTFLNYCNVVTLMSRAVLGWNRPLVVSERNTLGPSLRPQRFAFIKRRLIRRFYPLADAVIAVSKGCKNDLMESVGVPEEKISVIYNPLDIEGVRAKAREPIDRSEEFKPGIIAVGRLTAGKDYPTLLKAFRMVRRSADVHLTIVGDGEERARLEELSRHLGIDEAVSFPGFLKNPYGYMARSRLLALSSAWEGFPNVIPEAMACGTPVVATDCRSGPGEIIRDGEDGLLVPPGDQVKLAKGMLRVLESEDLRKKFIRAGAKRIQAFRIEDVTREYEALVMSAIDRA